MSLLIKNGTIVTAVDEFVGDVYVEGEKIVAVGKDLNVTADETIDANGKYVLPGGVDQHVHYSFEFKGEKVRGFETSNAAAVGGTTTVVEFVNQKEGKGLIETIDNYRKEEVEKEAMVDYGFHGVITDTSTGVFEEIKDLPDAGYTTVKLFMAYKGMPFHADDETIARALQEAKKAGVTVMVHAENADLIDLLQKEYVEKGETGPYGHVLSRPPLVEVEATERAINIAKLMEAPIYIVHVSTEGAIDAVKKASAEGFPVYGETCTHYLLLDKENLAKPNYEGAKYVCSPALRDQKDIEYMWKSVQNGWVNAISSDHCGFDWKNQKHMGIDDFRDTPNGSPGVENRFSLIWTYGVEEGKISRQQFVDLISTTPAKNVGLGHRKGHLGVGYDADIVIYNPNGKSTITNETSLQALDFNTYEGIEQIGKPEKVFLRGQLIVDDGEYIGKPGQGEFIPGKPYGLVYDRVER